LLWLWGKSTKNISQLLVLHTYSIGLKLLLPFPTLLWLLPLQMQNVQKPKLCLKGTVLERVCQCRYRQAA
jgi:hypothetical protein